MNLETRVFEFLEANCDFSRPILLALSGGPDSMCLLHLMLRARRRRFFPLHIVHVDHAWREESGDECKTIIQIAKTLGVDVHTRRLHPETYRGNREALAREDRLRFFLEVQDATGAQGIFLAHHRDDQQETVFKRFLEGGALLYLAGIRPITEIGRLTIFRPLLKVPKSELLSWVEGENIAYFEDPTNFNTQYLRGKLRVKIFPFLKEAFGKEFSESLVRLSDDAARYRAYFDDIVKPYLKHIVESDFGLFLDLSQNFPENFVIIREVLRCLLEENDIPFNRYSLDLASELLFRGQANKYVELEDKTLYIDRKRLFIMPCRSLEQPPEQKLVSGTSTFGSWKVTCEEGRGEQKNHWKDMWKGVCSTTVPKGEYFLTWAKPDARRKPMMRTLGRLFNDRKVPRDLASLVPVIASRDGVVEDFLLGCPLKESLETIHIKLEKI
jgi:tRNA(Ile)-lysidine synthase